MQREHKLDDTSANNCTCACCFACLGLLGLFTSIALAISANGDSESNVVQPGIILGILSVILLFCVCQCARGEGRQSRQATSRLFKDVQDRLYRNDNENSVEKEGDNDLEGQADHMVDSFCEQRLESGRQ